MGAVTKTFKSGNSVAVRLPKELGIAEGQEVTIRKFGDTVEITPNAKQRMTPKELVARLREIGPPADGVQKREKIIFPRRPGL